MNLGIAGKTALVVGASKGIGRAVALGLAAEGCRVVGVARDLKEFERLLPGAMTVEADLMTDDDAPRRAVLDAIRQAESGWPGHPSGGWPDIIYHCMGGSWGGLKAWDMPWSDWEKVYRFNLGVAHEINRLLVPAMLDRGWGRVVMTSTDGTASASGNPPYTSSKCALEGYVRTVAKQWVKRGVILTAVAPGNVYTPGLPMYEQSPEKTEEYWRHHVAAGRWAQPEEIARAILPLCGEPAAWMPGSIVRADGGAR